MTHTQRSVMGAFSVSCGLPPANSQPSPPHSPRLPLLSVHPAAPYRAPGVLVKGFGSVGGALDGNEPYCGAPIGPAVFVPSIHVQSLCPQSTTTVLTLAVTTPLKFHNVQPWLWVLAA